MNEAMDREIGRVFDSLTVYNLWANTDIIFIGDNGDDSRVAQSSPAKGSVYQGGLQVPMIISGPSVKSPNRTSDALVHTTDLFATILELFGHSQWASQIPSSKPVDSKSLLPILKNNAQDVHDWIFAEVFKGPNPASDGKTIRNKTYKFIKLDDGTKKLFNLAQDPNEKTNLYSENMTGSNLTNWEYLCGEMSKLLGATIGCSLVLSTEMESLKAIPFPNPFSTNIQFANQSEELIYVLFAADGKEIYRGTNIKNQDFSFLPKGVYYLQSTENIGALFKMIKE